MNEVHQLLTSKEVAKILRTGEDTLAVQRCIKSPNTPPWLKIGRKVLYRRDALEAFLAKRRAV